MKSLFWRLLGSGLALGAMFAMVLISTSDDANAAVFSHKYDGYLTRTYTDKQDASMTYYLYVPRGYNPRQSYPLVLLLHGGGERGETKSTLAQNRSLLLNDAYANVWSSLTVQSRWPSFVVAPQIVGTNQWVNTPSDQGSYQLAPQPSVSLRLAKEIVDALQREYQGIDSNRLYITGLSMGGYGAWDAIERWPTYFAAAAPIAGAGDPTQASVLTHLPIWAFHGAEDMNVPVSGSRDMVQAIRAAGGQPSYTEYPQAGHDIWMQVYTSSDFLSWLFAQHADS